MPELARISVYPIKSFDPLTVKSSRIVENGGLEHDREYAVFDEEGEYVNGKRTSDVHRIRASFERGNEIESVEFHPQGEKPRSFKLSSPELDSYLSNYFGYPVNLKRNEKGGFPDDTEASGPTLISTATLEEVASWFSLSVEETRLRFRANLEVDGVPAFWEDRLFGEEGESVKFKIGSTVFKGVNPCQRCVVPTRNPYTGEGNEDFREKFVEKREETLPDWTHEERFDHYFRLMVNTKVPRQEWGSEIAVGDKVEVLD